MPEASPSPAPAAPAAPTTPAAAPAAPTKQAATTAPKPADKPGEKRIRVRGYERAVQVKEKLAAEEGPLDDGDSTDAEQAPAKPANDVKPAGPGLAKAEPKQDDEAAAREKRFAERQERIRKAQERERAEKAQRQASQHSKTRDSEVEQLRKRIAELEPHEAVFKDEETLLAAAEARGMSAQKLVEWMRTRLNDPATIAQRHAKTEADALRAELRKVQDRLDQEAQDRETARAQAEEQRAGVERAHQFIGKVQESEGSHPLTLALAKKYGPNTLIAFASRFVAPMLRPDYDLQELHDHVEQFIEEVQMYGPAAVAGPQDGKSHSPKNAAGQAPTTLSNRTAQERVSVTQEVAAHLVPRRERTARLKQRLDGEDRALGNEDE